MIAGAGLHHNAVMLAIGTASYYLSSEQAGWLAGWIAGWLDGGVLTRPLYFFSISVAATPPLHGQPFIIYRPVWRCVCIRQTHMHPSLCVGYRLYCPQARTPVLACVITETHTL